MGKQHKNTEKSREPKPADGASTRLRRRDAASQRLEKASHGKVRSWLKANRTDLRFLLVFGLCMVLYYVSTLTPPVKDGFFPAYLRLNASVSGAILRGFGEDVTVRDQSMISAKGPAIEIERGCDAVEPSALFVSAVLASPVPVLSRLWAALAGTFVLMVLNLIRVVSLFLVRVYFPDAFETVHLDVWQALFIFLAIVFWAMWASRMSRRRVAQADAST